MDEVLDLISKKKGNACIFKKQHKPGYKLV